MNISAEKLTRYDEFVEALDLLDEESRFEYIIDIGRKADAEPFPPEAMDPAHEMHGCMSKVWIIHDGEDGVHRFRGESDAIIVKGLVSMMTQSFSGLTGDELQQITLDHVRRLNLGSLTMQRQVGMMAMLKHMQKLSRRAGAAAA
ncbi:MAG: SufE family protein [Alphaproteobacteria bacterium]|jgi:cysteine desulfuration protein SufE|nr:SufE family protein [Alphaproteobacteria bacterium]MDP6566583.1 SufE family protein [Alphaproteobacteria bacterium]